jgi:hypothetical protein
LGFRATDDQAAKVQSFADRAGVNASEVLRMLVDAAEDIQPVQNWSIVWGNQSQRTEVQG